MGAIIVLKDTHELYSPYTKMKKKKKKPKLRGLKVCQRHRDAKENDSLTNYVCWHKTPAKIQPLIIACQSTASRLL